MPVNRSAQIKMDAKALLNEGGVESLLKQFGAVIYSGSYALDLMVWNDIDLYLVPEPNTDWDECAADVCRAFAARKDVDTVRIEKSFWRKLPVLPKGIYVGVKIPAAGYTLPWKLDIWLVDETIRAQNKKLLEGIQQSLNPITRELIIRSKSAMVKEGRTPSHSSVHVYQAVLEKGLCSVGEVVDYVHGLGEDHRRSTQLIK